LKVPNKTLGGVDRNAMVGKQLGWGWRGGVFWKGISLVVKKGGFPGSPMARLR